MGRTPERTLKLSVSWESMEVPEYQPLTDWFRKIICSVFTSREGTAPITISLP